MSSVTQKAAPQSKDGGGEETYITSKEDKEAMLNRKMEEIRRKNEALKKRHEMIQADRLAAEKSGQAVNVKLSATSEPSPPHKPQMRGVFGDNEGQEGRKSKFAAGRAKRLANRSKEELRTQNYEVKLRSENAGNAPGGKQSSGSTRSQEPKSPSEGGPPPDPGYSFLADRSREGPLPDSRGGRREHDRHDRDHRGDRGGGGRRHPRNFGGGDFSNVKHRIQHDKYSQGRPRGGVKSDMDMQLHMTGKERREYTEWKKEREKIDMSRRERQKTAEGDWRREWDREKDEEAFDSTPAPPMSRHVEPARRPGRKAGRIGSGRFDRGDDDRNAGPGYEPEGEREDFDRERGERGGRGFGSRGGRGDRDRGGRGGRGSGRGERGGGGRGGRGRKPEEKQRTISSGSDDRSVEEQNDSLLIKVDNEFAQRGGSRGGRGGRGGQRRSQGRGASERGEEPKRKEKSEGDQNQQKQQQAEGKEDQAPKPEREFRLGAPRGARNKKFVGSGRIGSGRLAASHDNEEVIIEDEEGNQSRQHLNSSGSAGEWETDTSSQSLTADGDEPPHNAEDDDYWEDDEEFYKFQSTELDEDLHNSSLESFDDSSFHRFIEKNTLRIDAKTGLPTRDKSGHHIPMTAVTPTSPDPTSPIHSLKTPTDHKKVLDWGAEMDELSPAGSKSGTSSSQSPNDSPQRKQDKVDNQNISISDQDDSLNTSAETKRQILFPETDEGGDHDNPEKKPKEKDTVEKVEETATDQSEPEGGQGQVDEDKKSETRQDTQNSSEPEEKLPAKSVEDKPDEVEERAKDDTKEVEEEDEEFEDAAEDEEADEFVDAGSNVATPQSGSREVSAEPSPQTSPQHKASVQRQEVTSQDDDDVIEEEVEGTSKDDVAKVKENVTNESDDVTEIIDDVQSKTDETETKTDDVKDTEGDVAKEDQVTSSTKEDEESSQAEEGKSEDDTSSAQQQGDSVGESDGANVNTETSPAEGTEEEKSPPEDVTTDKTSPEVSDEDVRKEESQEYGSKDTQPENTDNTEQTRPDTSATEEKKEEQEANETAKSDEASVGSEDKPHEASDGSDDRPVSASEDVQTTSEEKPESS